MERPSRGGYTHRERHDVRAARGGWRRPCNSGLRGGRASVDRSPEAGKAGSCSPRTLRHFSGMRPAESEHAGLWATLLRLHRYAEGRRGCGIGARSIHKNGDNHRSVPCRLHTLVSLLTLLNFSAESNALIPFVMPGLLVTMIMTGGHGGPSLAIMIGTAIGFLVNVMVYFVLFIGLFSMTRRLARNGLSKS